MPFGGLEYFIDSSCYDIMPMPLDDGVRLLPPLKCALDPLKRLCHMKASLSSNSISFSVHSRVGRACKNIITSWKSILTSLSDHLTRNAAQTYRWNSEKPCSSAIYVSHILMVFLTLISLINKQFIHRKLNWINSTPSSSRCFASCPSILAVRSRSAATWRWIPGCAKM